jgi:ABC-type antimicrobial peptide transport system permease subunit
MLAYWVALRIRELGLRMALGATMGTVIRMVLRHNLQAVLAGLVLGLLAAAALARTLASFLFGVSPTDFATYVAVTVLVGILAMLSSVAACIRATRVDPLLALKS